MKKKIGIFLVLIIFLAILLLYFFKILPKHNLKLIDNDFSKYLDEEIFFQDAEDLIRKRDSAYSKDYDDSNIFIRISVYDTNLQPIKNSEFEFYDYKGDVLLNAKTNNEGRIGIKNFKVNAIYYFKQKSTSENLVIDDTAYRFTSEYKKQSFYQTLINGDHSISEEEKEKYITKLNNSNKSDDSYTENTYLINSDELKKEKTSLNSQIYNYKFLKNELSGLDLDLTVSILRNDDQDYEQKKCTIRIPNAFIENFSIDKQYDNNNNIKILDTEEKEKKNFQDGESFILEYPENIYLGDIRYKFTITFIYNGKRYKVSKKIPIDIDSNQEYLNMIKLTLIDPSSTTNERWTEGKVKLERFMGDTEDLMYMGSSETGSDGVIKFYYVPDGKYKITKMNGTEEISSTIVDVKYTGEDIEVQF